MAKSWYNTFVVINCKTRGVELVTSSARKAAEMLETGRKLEIWNANEKVKEIYSRDVKTDAESPLKQYIDAERMHIGLRQKAAEERNMRKGRAPWLTNRT